MNVIPVTPSYAQSSVASRPGAVTAIGVISIILASIALITNVVSGIFGLTSITTTKVQQIVVNRQDVDRYPLVAPQSASAPDAMSDEEAFTVAAGLSRVKLLTPARMEHVKTLARVHGKTMFPFTSGNVSAARVAGNVSDSGEVLGGGGARTNYYVLGEGRLEVSDTQATFRADDGKTYRSTDPPQDNSISEPSIDAMLRSLAPSGAPPNAAQKLTIQKLLRDPQQLIVEGDSGAQVVFAGPLKDGGIWFSTPVAQVRLDNAGKATLLSAGAPEPGTNALTGRKLTTKWANLLMLESLLSGLLAILLLIGAIFLVRGRPIGRKLCTVWALIKFPLVIAGAIFLGMAISEWLAAITSDSSTPPSPSIAPVVIAGLHGVVGLVWATIVLIALTRASVRDYFKNVV